MSITDQLLDLLAYANAEQHAFITNLPAAERDAAGAADRWSAKDNMSHVVEWNRRLVERLEAIARGDTPPTQGNTDIDHENSLIFEQFRDHSWDDIRARLDAVHVRVSAYVRRVGENGLLDANGSAPGREPWKQVAGNFVTHALLHLISYHAEHGRGAQAVQMNEALAAKLSAMDQSPEWRGTVIYNLACAYAIGGQKADAIRELKEALRMRPDLTDWSKEDPDFASIRDDPAFQAIYG